MKQKASSLIQSAMRKIRPLQNWLSSLRTQLSLLVLLTVLPALGLTFYTTNQYRRHVVTEATGEALQIAQFVSVDEEQLIEGTSQLLITLTKLSEIYSIDSSNCNVFLDTIHKQYPFYTVIGIIDSRGYSLCSSPSIVQRRLYLGDRPYFKKALQTHNFAVGKYQIGRISGKPSITFSYPILSKRGRVRAVVYVALDLSWLNQLVARAKLPNGAAFTVIDQDGTILAHSLDWQAQMGKSISGSIVYKTIMTHKGEGTSEVYDVDGKWRLYAFTRLHSAPAGSEVYVTLGIPSATAFAKANQLLIYSFLELGLVVGLALIAIWFGSDSLILQPINVLLNLTKQLNAGDLSVRTRLAQRKGELGELAASFDTMATSLERNFLERNQALEILRASETELRALFAAMNDVIVVVNREGRYLKIAPTNPDFKYNFNSVLIGKTVHDVFSQSQADTFLSYIRQSLDLQQIIQVEYSLEINDREAWFAAGISPLMEDAVIWVARDITERKHTEQQLLHNAWHDALTNLPNRALFMERLGQVFEYTKQRTDYLFAVLFLDLDRFKVINDSLGHLVGDELLIAIAYRVEKCLRPTDLIARFGGDEFTILLNNIRDSSDATEVADRIHKVLAQPLSVSGHEVFTSASIGIALGGKEYSCPEQLLRDADIAMYKAKTAGKNCYELFTPGLHSHAVALLELETDLRRAIEHQQFKLHYQPIVSLKDVKVIGFEALLRWQHPKHGLIFPKEFMQVVEENGLIIPIGRWVLKEACHQLCLWQAQFPTNPPLSININISAKQFLQIELINQIEQILQKTGLNAHSLKLEITETVLMANAESTVTMLSQLKKLGLQLYIDDFGTGFSSLSYLHRLPVDALKIDRSFISQIESGGSNLEIVQTIVTLANNLGIDVIAEGIETEKQLTRLRELNCTYGQGYFFSKPLNSNAIDTVISNLSAAQDRIDTPIDVKSFYH